MNGKQDEKYMPDGSPVQQLIDGVVFRKCHTHTDSRGTLTEILDLAWGISDFPIPQVHAVTIRPRVAKGWIVHHLQYDRVFILQGSMKIVLYDNRTGSKTCGVINEIYTDDYNRGLIIIPPFVWHTFENIGLNDIIFVNCVTHGYDPQNPDKHRLPLDTSQIPYKFNGVTGW